MSKTDNIGLLDPLDRLPMVGPALKSRLESLGMLQVQDLLFHLPLRYEDRSRTWLIAEAPAGMAVGFQGRVRSSRISYGKRRIFSCVLEDDSSPVKLVFFNFYSNLGKLLADGREIRCFGEIRPGRDGLECMHPQVERLDIKAPSAPENLTPIYPSTEGLQQQSWLRLSGQALGVLEREAPEDLLPDRFFDSRASAIKDTLLLLHRPPLDENIEALNAHAHAAHERLAIEELSAHILAMRQRRNGLRSHSAPVFPGSPPLVKRFLKGLPFQLTDAQRRVAAEIAKDLAAGMPMLRLLQGDVGAGKTVIAALAAIQCVAGGAQVAIAAPTEILANQHRDNFQPWAAELGIKLSYLSGRTPKRERSQTLSDIAGDADIVIGTHALMVADVRFRNLGLSIIDEQHRFGVSQRLNLGRKANSNSALPHQLIMTATPIPRTLAMTAYAHLDLSIIDQLPPGRKPVATSVISQSRRDELIARTVSLCTSERQAFWVCTLVEESETLDAAAAEETFAEIRALAGKTPVGLIHGRMHDEDKSSAMAEFAAGRTRILVATTVIEVGIDVPNASMMIIDNAERLGLSSLHQLRGRVGRGSAESQCVLLYQAPLSKNARTRLDTMRNTNDGFQIARQDLKIRGPGEILGTRQTGVLLFKIANLEAHQHLIPKAQKIADYLLGEDSHKADQLVSRWTASSAEYVNA